MISSKDLERLLFDVLGQFLTRRASEHRGVGAAIDTDSGDGPAVGLALNLVDSLAAQLLPGGELWLIEVIPDIAKSGKVHWPKPTIAVRSRLFKDGKLDTLREKDFLSAYQQVENSLPTHASNLRPMMLAERRDNSGANENSKVLLIIDEPDSSASASKLDGLGLLLFYLPDGTTFESEILSAVKDRLEGLEKHIYCHRILLDSYRGARGRLAELKARENALKLDSNLEKWEQEYLKRSTIDVPSQAWPSEAQDLLEEIERLEILPEEKIDAIFRIAKGAVQRFIPTQGVPQASLRTSEREANERRKQIQALSIKLEKLIISGISHSHGPLTSKTDNIKKARIDVLSKILSLSLNEAPSPREGEEPAWDLEVEGEKLLLDRAIFRFESVLVTATAWPSSTTQPAWVAEEDISLIGEVLESLFASHETEGFDSRYLPTWLRLWFCYELLCLSSTAEDEPDSPDLQRVMPDVQTRRFRHSLVFLTRECLRMLNYGHRRDFVFQPGAFMAALVTLVDFHARWILKVPKVIDIRRFLETIGRSVGPDEPSASGHLQHALEVYIACIFLARTSVEHGGSAKSMAEVLAEGRSGYAAQLRTREFEKALALTALFHDVGMVILPSRPGHRLETLTPDRHLESTFAELRQIEAGHHTDFMRRCRDEILAAGYVSEASEAAIVEWMDEVVESGAPDHSLVGAWYLHRLFVKGDGTPEAEITRAVVRATLLHRCGSLPIRVDEDPVAALLVICDEIFDWSPSMGGLTTPDRVGRAFYSFVTDAGPDSPRFSHSKFPGLTLEPREKNSGRILGLWRPQKNGQGHRAWPAFELDFLPHEALGRPIYHYWLVCSQNLERLDPGIRDEETDSSFPPWNPEVVLRSATPPELREEPREPGSRLSTRDLLAEAVERSGPLLAGPLETWLGQGDRFEESDDGERLRLRGRGKSWQGRQLQGYLEELDRAMDESLRERAYRATLERERACRAALERERSA